MFLFPVLSAKTEVNSLIIPASCTSCSFKPMYVLLTEHVTKLSRENMLKILGEK